MDNIIYFLLFISVVTNVFLCLCCYYLLRVINTDEKIMKLIQQVLEDNAKKEEE